jgi:Flp pilus assembly protein TadD
VSTAADHGGAEDAAAALDEGRAAFAARDLDAAHDAFRRAHRRTPADPAAMSWYAVTLVLVERNSNLGVVLCEQSLRQAGPDPELLLNQARVHLALNQRERAVRAIVRGLELWPDDPRLCAARDAIGTRRPPVIPFLSRNNPLNRLFGLVRYRWSRRSGPVYELSPVALGEPGVAPGGEPVAAPCGEPARS